MMPVIEKINHEEIDDPQEILSIQHQLTHIPDNMRDDRTYTQLRYVADQIPWFEPDRRQVRIPVESKKTARTHYLSIGNGQRIRVTRKPAFIEAAAGEENYLYYPHIREANVHDAIWCLASTNGIVRYANMIGVMFDLHSLKSVLHELSDGKRNNYMQYDQIIMALRVLLEAKYEISYLNEDGSSMPPIMGSLIKTIVSSDRMENFEHDENLAESGHLFVQLHEIFNEDIRKLDFRQADYDILSQLRSIAHKVLYKEYCLRFINANSGNHFDISVMELRSMATLNTPDSMIMREARKPLVTGIEALKRLGKVRDYELIKEIKGIRKTDGERKRKRASVIDEIYRIYPTDSFINDQKRSNAIKRNNALIYKEAARNYDTDPIQLDFLPADPELTPAKISRKHHLINQQLSISASQKKKD